VTAPAAGQETSLGTIRLPPGAILTGLVTRNGQPTADAVVQVRVGGTGPRHHFVLTRTRRDGSYQLSLPAALTVKRLCAHAPRHPCPGSGRGSGQGPGYAFADDLVMGKPGSTATRNLGFEL